MAVRVHYEMMGSDRVAKKIVVKPNIFGTLLLESDLINFVYNYQSNRNRISNCTNHTSMVDGIVLKWKTKATVPRYHANISPFCSRVAAGAFLRQYSSIIVQEQEYSQLLTTRARV